MFPITPCIPLGLLWDSFPGANEARKGSFMWLKRVVGRWTRTEVYVLVSLTMLTVLQQGHQVKQGHEGRIEPLIVQRGVL